MDLTQVEVYVPYRGRKLRVMPELSSISEGGAHDLRNAEYPDGADRPPYGCMGCAFIGQNKGPLRCGRSDDAAEVHALLDCSGEEDDRGRFGEVVFVEDMEAYQRMADVLRLRGGE